MVSAMADSEDAFEFLAADLAPGERKALELDCSELELRRICSETDSLFDVAYDHLWNEFGSKNEMESRPVIAHRLGLHPATQLDGYWLRYEIIMVRHRTRFVAVRDHTAIVSDRRPSRAIVHLSHVLIEPGWRRTGLAGWLRAWPLQTARACLAAAGHAVNSPITLVAEMEHPEPQFPTGSFGCGPTKKPGSKKSTLSKCAISNRTSDRPNRSMGREGLSHYRFASWYGGSDVKQKGVCLAPKFESWLIAFTACTRWDFARPTWRSCGKACLSIPPTKQRSPCCHLLNDHGVLSPGIRRADRGAHHAHAQVCLGRPSLAVVAWRAFARTGSGYGERLE